MKEVLNGPVSSGGYVSRNLVHRREPDGMPNTAIIDDTTPRERHSKVHRRRKNQNRREIENEILEHEEKLRGKNFTEEEIAQFVHDFRCKVIRTERDNNSGSTWSKKRQRGYRSKDVRKTYADSSRKFAEAFHVRSELTNENFKSGQNPLENVFDARFQDARRKAAREKRLHSIWKNKALMKKLRADVYNEEYFKIFDKALMGE